MTDPVAKPTEPTDAEITKALDLSAEADPGYSKKARDYIENHLVPPDWAPLHTCPELVINRAGQVLHGTTARHIDRIVGPDGIAYVSYKRADGEEQYVPLTRHTLDASFDEVSYEQILLPVEMKLFDVED